MVPDVHPRFRRRRIEVTREEGRRRLRVVLACMAVTALVGGGAAASRSPLLDVDAVELRGAQRTAHVEVLAVTGLGRHPLMVEVDAVGVARRVETLPWVLRARARRRWPGTVRIDVRERAAVAVLPAAGARWALTDRTGRILAVTPDQPSGLPVVLGGPPAGPPGTSAGPRVPGALGVASALPGVLRPRVAAVAADAGGGVELHLRDGGVVRLGRAEQLGAKLAAAATVLEKAAPAGNIVLDVRVPAAPVLTRR